jgi:hypothetical protein
MFKESLLPYNICTRDSLRIVSHPSFLPLGATARGELWPPEQSASILLYSEADCLVSE